MNLLISLVFRVIKILIASSKYHLKKCICCLDLQVAALHLSSQTLNVGSVLDQESRMWLSAIYRRLARKVGIRKPFYGEITRSIPIYVFLCLRQVLRDLNAIEPQCYLGKNKKAEVVSLTSNHLVHRLFACLSGQTIKEVKKFFWRTLTGTTRYHHKVKILISASKDFAFVYKKNSGQLCSFILVSETIMVILNTLAK